MAKQVVQKDDVSRIEYIFIQNSSVTTGAGLTALVFNSAGLTAYYVRMQAAATAITLATQTVTGAFSSGGFVEVDAANMPGIYRVDIPNAAFATGVDKVIVHLKGATNMAPVSLEYQLVNYNPEDAVRLGLTALPNAAAEAAGGLYTRGTGAGQINQDANGRVDTNTAAMAASVLTAAAIAADAITAAKIANGAIDAATFAAGAIDAAAIAADAIDADAIAANAIDAASIATGAITAAKFAAGAIDAAAIATDAIDGDALAATALAEIKTQVTDALNVDTYAEIGQEAPAATQTIRKMLGFVYKAWRNRKTQTATTWSLFNDDAVTVDQKSTVADDGTTASRAEVATGP